MAFGHAAGRHQALTRGFAGRHLAQHAKRLVARGGDEAAGVDNHDIGVAGLRDRPMALRRENAAHALAIDGVLWAT
jgi:hypothetical protein